MSHRSICEDQLFTEDLKRLIPDCRESDEVLQFAMEWFACNADLGNEITDGMWIKTIPDFPRSRWLVIYYTKTETVVHLRSVRHFDIN
jgi:hypothetical protein